MGSRREYSSFFPTPTSPSSCLSGEGRVGYIFTVGRDTDNDLTFVQERGDRGGSMIDLSKHVASIGHYSLKGT